MKICVNWLTYFYVTVYIFVTPECLIVFFFLYMKRLLTSDRDLNKSSGLASAEGFCLRDKQRIMGSIIHKVKEQQSSLRPLCLGHLQYCILWSRLAGWG